MNNWLHKFMEKPDISDNTDRLSENMENMPRAGPDKPDRFEPPFNMSVLSVRPGALLGENLNNLIKIGPDISDNTDRLDPNLNMSGLSGSSQDVLERFSLPYDKQDFEERLAIAEYDGGQTPLHAHRIAYLDAFISSLTALPATESQKDWLDKRIQTSLAWIEVNITPAIKQ